MKYIKTYEIFGGLKKFFKKNIEPIFEPIKPKVYNNIDDILEDKSLSHLDRVKKIDTLCKKFKIYGYTLNSDYSINYNSVVNFDNMGLNEIPLKFKKVYSFSINNNNLKSLRNCPIETKYFNASYNKIETLEFCPKITETIRLNNNKIKSIEGLPDCEHINLEKNEISDISSVINLSYKYLNLSNNNIIELYPLSLVRSLYIMDNPIYSIILRLCNGSYPDSNWVDSFNSYNIIYNDGVGKPKLFTDNLLLFKNMEDYRLKSLIKLIEEYDAYEITTMEEYFNKQNKDTDN